MIIKSIAFQNFQCYSGSLEENTFEFSKGLNVIIGDNGSGKSKIYDGFRWLLYDHIFNSAIRSFQSTQIAGQDLVSDKAKNECDIGEKVEAKVKVVLENDKEDGSLSPEMFSLERSFSIERKEEGEGKDVWKVDNSSKTKIERKDVLDFKKMHEPDAFQRITRKLLPVDMEPYLWFQGEQVDSLIDFKKEDSLTQAINVLSDINLFDYYIQVAEKVSSQAANAYKTEVRKKTRDDSDSIKNQEEQERLEKAIEKEQENLTKIKENILLAEDKKEELLGKIEDAQELEKLKNKLISAERSEKEIQDKINHARKNFNNNLFSKKWVLKNAKPFFNKFEQLQKEYDEKRENLKLQHTIEKQQNEAKEHKLPENVPNKSYLEDMLKEKKCYLCDREFSEGDHAEKYLQDLLEKTKNQKVKYSDFLKNDIKRGVQDLYMNAYQNSNIIPGVDQSIQKALEEIEKLEDELDEKRKTYKDIQIELNHLAVTGNVSQEESRNIVSSFRSYDEAKERYQEDKFEIEKRLEHYQSKLKEVEEKLKETLGSEIDPKIQEKKEILDTFLSIAKSTRNNVYHEQIKKIEEEANKHFRKMTQGNSSVRGSIKLEKVGRSYMPKNVDDKGIELTSINDSNIILIKIATIMAIVSAKGSTEKHPMISDAPTSKFSDNYTIGFCRAISKVFNQSIIVSYDFYNNQELRNMLFSEVENLGKVYLIKPSIPEEKRMNRYDLSTLITQLN